jgi:hypothetical protein
MSNAQERRPCEHGLYPQYCNTCKPDLKTEHHRLLLSMESINELAGQIYRLSGDMLDAERRAGPGRMRQVSQDSES